MDRVADSYAPYVVPVGSGEQLLPVIAAGIDRVIIDFSEQVAVLRNQLTVVGRGGPYAFAAGGAGFSTGTGPTPGTWRTTWGFATPIFADQLTLTLSDAIVDTGQIRLDGEWNNPASTDPGAGQCLSVGKSDARRPIPISVERPGRRRQPRLACRSWRCRGPSAGLRADIRRELGRRRFRRRWPSRARDLALLQSQLGDSLVAPSPARSNAAPAIDEPRRLAAKSVRSQKIRDLAHDAALLEATDVVAAKPTRLLRAAATRRAIADDSHASF